jgi:DNA-binding response OmpR family regulator
MVVVTPSPKKKWDVTKRTALVVEDDPHLQKAMSKQLERMNFQVLSAQHYEAAALHLAKLEPKIACVDVQLPCKSGYQLCEYIRRALGFLKLPILMTSDHGSPTDMAYAEDAGANAFLCKPFSMRELGECVESLLNAVGRLAAPTHELQLLVGTPGWLRYAADRSGQYPVLSAA